MDKRKLIISSKAELKIHLAMKKLGSLEVSWFGKIKQTSKGDFMLSDVYFPPQENMGAFVTTKDDEFPQWFFETFVKKGIQNTIRLHGHTHPNFGTSPSGTDIDQFGKFLNEVDDYMIQLIMSNRYEPHCQIWHKEGKREYLKVIFDYSERINKVLDKVCHIQERKVYRRPSSFKTPPIEPIGEMSTEQEEYYNKMMDQYFKDEDNFKQGSLFPVEGGNNGAK